MPFAVPRKGKGKATPPEKVTPSLPLGKQLAHTDKAIRDCAIEGLVAFLSSGAFVDEESGESSTGYTPLSEAEMDKLWKGLFYCFWMSDKPLIQQALASNLAELLLLIKPAGSGGEADEDCLTAALAFLGGFWRAIVREWSGIDRLRMDKFYMLIRRYLNATFRLLAREEWSKESLVGVNGILMADSGPMTWRDRSVPSSIATHLGDIWLEELDRVVSLPEVNSQPACPLIPILQPLITLLARTPTQTVHTRLMSTVFKPLLSALNLATPNPDSHPAKRTKTDEVYPHLLLGCCLGKEGCDDRAKPEEIRKSLLQALFNAAADETATEVNRRKIYKVWREEGGDDDE